MQPLLIAIGIMLLCTVLSEGILWWIFRRKLTPLLFPHELDTSFFRFLSLARLRAIGIAHTVIVLLCVTFCLIFLW